MGPKRVARVWKRFRGSFRCEAAYEKTRIGKTDWNQHGALCLNGCRDVLGPRCVARCKKTMERSTVDERVPLASSVEPECFKMLKLVPGRLGPGVLGFWPVWAPADLGSGPFGPLTVRAQARQAPARVGIVPFGPRPGTNSPN